MAKRTKKQTTKKPKVRRIEVVGRDDGPDADAADTAPHGAHTAPTGADDAAAGPMDAPDDTGQHGADVAATGEAESRRARKGGRAKKPKPFTHDPRVAALVGQTLTHTDRGGTTHTVEILDDGFLYGGQRFKSLSAAARVAAKGKSVNGLLYFGVIKSAARSGSKRDPIESLSKAFTKYRDRAATVVKNATTEDLANVSTAIRQHVEALQEVAARTVERIEAITSANDSPAETNGAEAQ